jgi:hypothetical protein
LLEEPLCFNRFSIRAGKEAAKADRRAAKLKEKEDKRAAKLKAKEESKKKKKEKHHKKDSSSSSSSDSEESDSDSDSTEMQSLLKQLEDKGFTSRGLNIGDYLSSSFLGCYFSSFCISSVFSLGLLKKSGMNLEATIKALEEHKKYVFSDLFFSCNELVFNLVFSCSSRKRLARKEAAGDATVGTEKAHRKFEKYAEEMKALTLAGFTDDRVVTLFLFLFDGSLVVLTWSICLLELPYAAKV